MNNFVKALNKFKVAEYDFARIEGKEGLKITEHKIKAPVVIFAILKETWDELQRTEK